MCAPVLHIDVFHFCLINLVSTFFFLYFPHFVFAVQISCFTTFFCCLLWNPFCQTSCLFFLFFSSTSMLSRVWRSSFKRYFILSYKMVWELLQLVWNWKIPHHFFLIKFKSHVYESGKFLVTSLSNSYFVYIYFSYLKSIIVAIFSPQHLGIF